MTQLVKMLGNQSLVLPSVFLFFALVLYYYTSLYLISPTAKSLAL